MKVLTKWQICRADIRDGGYMPWFANPPGTVFHTDDPNEESEQLPDARTFRTWIEAMRFVDWCTTIRPRYFR